MFRFSGKAGISFAVSPYTALFEFLGSCAETIINSALRLMTLSHSFALGQGLMTVLKPSQV